MCLPLSWRRRFSFHELLSFPHCNCTNSTKLCTCRGFTWCPCHPPTHLLVTPKHQLESCLRSLRNVWCSNSSCVNECWFFRDNYLVLISVDWSVVCSQLEIEWVFTRLCSADDVDVVLNLQWLFNLVPAHREKCKESRFPFTLCWSIIYGTAAQTPMNDTTSETVFMIEFLLTVNPGRFISCCDV